MKTNELKKGQRVKLANGWEAEIADNMRGNTRMAKVFGYHTEIGSVYAHDITHAINEFEDGDFMRKEHVPIEHTKSQLKLKEQLKTMGF